ncbi:FtsK/SpoIIIE domain-containing protein [Dactylosporangium sp. NPDC005555]|uniref:FtsK/SpoIIIE domain-containing protein n=1 Tax=Dactylosporangium sp. NPDC005555 TaxID=3154889 RepID=UPI0033BCC07C
MTTSGAWVRASPVAARLAAARSRLPAGALELACHAAVPVAVDAGLLHLLRINFFLDPPTVLPFDAEAALLLSPLFREVGEDLYEIDPTLRDALLASLVARFGAERPARVAVLLEQYTDQHPTWHTQPELEHAQRLTALNLVDPARAADWLAANRTAAGGPALTREWFVAMSGRLRPRASLQERTRLAIADQGPEALAELAELALLPGADVRAIALYLESVTHTDPSRRDLAAGILDTITRLVPPPPRQRVRELALDGYRATPFPALHGIDPATFTPAWDSAEPLPVPIGSDPDGRPVTLSLLAPGQHAMIVGATGSGKSELLRTLILGLAVTNSPQHLNILPVDFRGGATFAGLESLPHLAGLVVDNGDVMSLVERLKQVLLGEVDRRQQKTTVTRPRLLIVIDEFHSFLTIDPSFVDVLVTVGRLGPSLGIHLILSTQRFEPGRSRGLEPLLSHRIVLRTLSQAESHDAIGGPQAFHLPGGPGHGYLRIETGALLRFRAAYVSGPYPPPAPSWADILDPYGAPRSATLLDHLVGRMAGHGGPVHQVWLPPLPAELALGDLPAGDVTIGEVDAPRDHQRRVLNVDLTGNSGHVVIVGGPRTGKTTALLTIVTSLARTARPTSVYCLGGDLGSLIDLPPVIDVWDPATDTDAITELLSFLQRAPSGDAVLVIDGWADALRRYPALDDLVFAGKAVIVATDERWSRFSGEHLAAFGTTIELCLADRAPSRISVPAGRLLRFEGPGRALVTDGLQLQIALPIRSTGDTHDAYMRDFAVIRSPGRVRLGTFEPDGAEFAIDFTTEPHLLVKGGSPADRQTVRQMIERSVTGRIVGPDQVEEIVEELRRSQGARDDELWMIGDGDLEPLTPMIEFLRNAREHRLHVIALAPSPEAYPLVSHLLLLTAPFIRLFDEPGESADGELIVEGPVVRRFHLDRPPPSPPAEPVRAWAAPGLVAPIGSDPDGRSVLLDLRDPSQGGTGPHGIIVGAAGSGKSELIRAVILGLAAANSPAELNVLPVSYFGRDTFAGLEDLPHLAGLAVKLSAEPSLVDRLVDVLAGEISRRQSSTEPLPKLVIVIDEFTELLDAQPSVIDTILQVCRVGRTLGIHLLLSTQRLEERRLVGLDTYLTYRIALRTFTADESRVVLGGPEAFELPHAHGHGYLRSKVDESLRRFRNSQVLGTLAVPAAGHGGPVHQIWLPPLPPVVALGDLPADGVTIGLADTAREHRQAPFTIDLSGGSVHVAIVGERGSGTTTVLQTVVAAIARQDLPCHVYCLGGGLNTIADLPFVGGVFHRHDGAAIARLVSFLDRRPRGAEPPVVVIVDNWPRVVRDHPVVRDLITDGLATVVATGTSWSAFGADLSGFRPLVELSLEDPATSRFSAVDARRIRGGRPGRGHVEHGDRVQLAAPVRHVGGNHHAYVAELAGAWTGQPAPRVEPDLRLRIGVHEDDGSDCVLDFARHPHLLIQGTGNVVDRLLSTLADWADGRVFDALDSPQVAGLIEGRLPRPNIPARHLVTRTSWTGPELWSITGDRSALDSLAEFLPDGRELGLHLVVASDETAGEPSGAVWQLIDLDTPTIAVPDPASADEHATTIERDGRIRPVLLSL